MKHNENWEPTLEDWDAMEEAFAEYSKQEIEKCREFLKNFKPSEKFKALEEKLKALGIELCQFLWWHVEYNSDDHEYFLIHPEAKTKYEEVIKHLSREEIKTLVEEVKPYCECIEIAGEED